MVSKEKIKSLPLNPGVYIMRDSSGTVIYVGKAKVLKNRVSQYFNHASKPRKVMAMVSNVADFEYIIVLTESDALALENNLIKKYKPYYNILLKDDKASPYIKIDTSVEYPSIEITRKVKRDGAKYFGPYFNGIRVNEIVDVIRTVYGIRTCAKTMRSRKRACLNYDIGLCKGCCMRYISAEEYAELVKKTMKFLHGDDEEAKRVLTQKMELAAFNEDFERAIKYRDSLEMLKKLSSRTIANLGSVTDIDVFSYASDGTYSVMSVAIVRGNKMLGVRNYPIVEAHLETKDVYAEFVAQYYSSPSLLPEEIDFTEEFDAQVIRDYLAGTGAKVDVVFPKIGTRGRIAEMARRNASDFLLKSVARQAKEEAMTIGAAARLAEILGVPSARRIECFDISDISGTDQVASDVCFIDGKADKSEYRRFSIKTVKGADDFASMREVIHRRLAKIAEGWEKPDLIVVDGGKGQLSSAIESVRETGVYVPVVSLAKKHEEIFVPSSDEPIRLSRDDNALKLMQRVRDEAHRFAVLYHRSVRAKRHGSELEKIPNIGKKNREILLSVFDSIAAIKSATLEELEGVSGLNKRAARSVYDYFKENP